MIDKRLYEGRFAQGELTLKYLEICSKDTEEEDFEIHHILPRSIFPEFIAAEWNLVKLSYAEHYVAHEILPKICLNERDEYKMLYAWNFINGLRKGEYISSPSVYAQHKSRLKIEKSRHMLERHKDPEFSKGFSERMHARHKDPEFAKACAERAAIRMRILVKDPEFSKAASERMSLLHKNPEFAARRNKRTSERMTRMNKDQDFKKLMRDSRRKPDGYIYEQLDLTGNLIQLWYNVFNVESEGFRKRKVVEVSIGKGHTHKGFIWRRYKVDEN